MQFVWTQVLTRFNTHTKNRTNSFYSRSFNIIDVFCIYLHKNNVRYSITSNKRMYQQKIFIIMKNLAIKSFTTLNMIV